MDISLDDLQNLLMQNYSRRQLEYLYRTFLQPMVAEEGAQLSEELKTEINELADGLSSPRNTLALTRVLCMLWSSQPWFDAFYARLDEEVQTLLAALVWIPELDEAQIRARFGMEVKGQPSFEGHALGLQTKFQALPHTSEQNWLANTGQQLVYRFALPAKMRLFLARYFETPPELRLEPDERRWETDFVHQDAGNIFAELPLVQIYFANGSLKFSKRGKPLASSINPMRKKLSLQEFFRDEQKMLASIRTTFLIHIWTTMGQRLSEEAMGLDLLEALAEQFWQTQFEVEELLVHLQQSTNMAPFYRPELGKTLRELLRSLPEGEWIDVKRAQNWATFRELPVHGVPLSVAQNDLSFKDGDGYKQKITPENYEALVGDASFRAGCFLLATFGMLDLQYDAPETESLGSTWFSPFEGLRYLRLTDLGAYLSGRSTEYQPPEMEETTSFILSEKTLQVLVSSHANPAKLEVLQRLALPLATRRYEITPASFLSGAQDLTELEHLIRLFRQNIAEQPPQIWEDFFETIREQAGKLKPLNGWVVYEVAPDRQLVRQIARDEQLRKLIVRAEGYRILVEQANQGAFVQRMKELGYLM